MAISTPRSVSSLSLARAVCRLHSQMRSKVDRLILWLEAKYSSKRFMMTASESFLLPVGPPLTISAPRIACHSSAQGVKEMRLTLIQNNVPDRIGWRLVAHNRYGCRVTFHVEHISRLPNVLRETYLVAFQTFHVEHISQPFECFTWNTAYRLWKGFTWNTTYVFASYTRNSHAENTFHVKQSLKYFKNSAKICAKLLHSPSFRVIIKHGLLFGGT